MNWLTPTKRTFKRSQYVCFKKDLIAVNGFNEEMQYGGLDREVGERLFNLEYFQSKLDTVLFVLHLDHAVYFNQEEWNKIWH